MGLFDKIKNILFEEEEIEIPTITKEERVVEEPVKAVKEEPITVPIKKEEVVPEMPLPVKKEKTFDFPIFDEEEFEENKTRSTRSSNILEYERKRKEEKKVDFGSRFDVQSNNSTQVKKPFRPSPVISPVYGILDKNYKKEDLIAKDTKKKEETSIDVDSVRKKAFGTLEDDIERTLNEPVKSFYDAPVIDETKTIDELLIGNADVTIPIEDDEESDTLRKDINEILEERPMIEDVLPEESLPTEGPTLEVLDEVENNLDEIAEKNKLENDTLESDLFDLIDSMYEQREEGEV